MTFSQWISAANLFVTITSVGSGIAFMVYRLGVSERERTTETKAQVNALEASTDTRLNGLQQLYEQRFDFNAKAFHQVREGIERILAELTKITADHEKRLYHVEETAKLWGDGRLSVRNGE